MRNQVTIVLFSLIVLASCDGYEASRSFPEAVQELNGKLDDARQKGENWTASPANIARQLFPPVSHDGGPKQYAITVEHLPANMVSVTVLEEGPIDDEVMGERRTIEFKFLKGQWNVTKYQYAAKRRY